MPLRVMVPLDGSESAEGALACVEQLRDKQDLEVLLVAVWEANEGFQGGDPVGRALAPQVLDCITGNLASYLSGAGERLQRQGVHTSFKVFTGHPLRDLSAVASRERIDLIITGPRGLAGPSCQYPPPRWCHGPCPLPS
ncbi:MAG: universal stress protein [Chloroflexi bacterium]|nr:universal stress protein [Chloroflexota bacterium]